MWPDNERNLLDYLRECEGRALDELDRIDPDTLLSENEDVLVATLLETHMPQPLEIQWAGVTRSEVAETKEQVRDPFNSERLYTTSASKITLHFPYTGSRSLLSYRASTYTMDAGSDWTMGPYSIDLELIEQQLTPDIVTARIERLREKLDQRLAWANADLKGFLPRSEAVLRDRIKQRKDRILSDRRVEDALGIPMVSTGVPRQPVPARRKQVSLQQRTSQKGFVPEYVLDEAHYREVLEQVQGWARTMERSPKTAVKLDEEELRDLLLGTLNGFWRGAAGGELFNGEGKTDILVRHDDRNVFIAELKHWRGPKTVHETIDQLLGYLVWRDSKAAVVIFIKTADPATTIKKLHREVESHPRYVLTKPGGDPATQVDYIFTADDEGRRISLAVIPVVLKS